MDNDHESNQIYQLLLFDIDGTLIRSAGAGREAMNRAFQKTYGIQNGFEHITMMGRTDPGILQEVLDEHHLDWDGAQIEQFQSHYYDFLDEELKKPRDGMRICAGIDQILSVLKNRHDIILGLLTGNWRYGAYLKLRHFGLDDYFTIGAFGDDSGDRNQLVPVAFDRFRMQMSFDVLSENTWVIGDTPLDILCGKPYGTRTIGVATGVHELKDLIAEKPDQVFEDFSDVSSLLRLFIPEEELISE
ncbi:HAD hydrolase-like protein [candidate division KSB1 bacterium]|nr:HAD hydrolase-like protein [candidate division KSB1 bacterium]